MDLNDLLAIGAAQGCGPSWRGQTAPSEDSTPDADPTLTTVTVTVDAVIGQALEALGPDAIITAATIRERDGERFVVVSEPEDDQDDEDAGSGDTHWLTRYDPKDGEPQGSICQCAIGDNHDAAGNLIA